MTSASSIVTTTDDSNSKLSSYCGEFPLRRITCILTTRDGYLIVSGRNRKQGSILLCYPDSGKREKISDTSDVPDMTWVQYDRMFAYIDRGYFRYSNVCLLKITSPGKKVSEILKFSTEAHCRAIEYRDSHFFLLFPRTMCIKIVTIQGKLRHIIPTCDKCGWGTDLAPVRFYFHGCLFLDVDYTLYAYSNHRIFFFHLNKETFERENHGASQKDVNCIVSLDREHLIFAKELPNSISVVSKSKEGNYKSFLKEFETHLLDESQSDECIPTALCVHDNELVVGVWKPKYGDSKHGWISEINVFQIDLESPINCIESNQ